VNKGYQYTRNRKYRYVCPVCDKTYRMLYLVSDQLACMFCHRLYFPPKRPVDSLNYPQRGTAASNLRNRESGNRGNNREKALEPKRAGLTVRELRAIRYGEAPPAPTPAGGRPGKPPRA